MGRHESDDSDYDSEEEEKVIFRKPQVFRLDKIKNVRRIIINLSSTLFISNFSDPVPSHSGRRLRAQLESSVR
jgi:hypothetical protein